MKGRKVRFDLGWVLNARIEFELFYIDRNLKKKRRNLPKVLMGVSKERAFY